MGETKITTFEAMDVSVANYEQPKIDGFSKFSNEDEKRLAQLGYSQEVKRIFSAFSNFGLAASMISVLLGFIPLYTFELQSGGPAIMFWSWIICGIFTIFLVLSLAEICSAYPTMGALYFWAFRLGGPDWGPFASWTAGWCNLLGQIAGVASGGYAGAEIFAEIIEICTGDTITNAGVLGLYAVMLVIAGVVNTFAETLLSSLCYISVGWQVAGVLLIVVWMLSAAPSYQSASFVFFGVINTTGFDSLAYVALVGSLAAASVFTGYDTASHVAEETADSHNSTPIAMLGSVINAFVLGVILILGMNFCIQDVDSLLTDDDGNGGGTQAYTVLWLQIVGRTGTIIFLVITLVAIECSNCANLTSAARMIYSFSRDRALPFSHFFHHIDRRCGGPTRAIWLATAIAFVLGTPGLSNPDALSALFSLTATGLYSSYIIPIFLRLTVGRETFKQAEFNLGIWSVPIGVISVLWGAFMTILLCLPQSSPQTSQNINYSPIALGCVLTYAWGLWLASARHWFKGAAVNQDLIEAASIKIKTNNIIGIDIDQDNDETDDDFNKSEIINIKVNNPLTNCNSSRLFQGIEL